MPVIQPSILENLLVLYARYFPLRRGKLRVVDALWPIAIGSRNTRRIARLNYGDLKMPCDLAEMLQRQFYFFGTYFLEEQILECWSDEARRAKVIFDIGANAGIFSLAALAVQPDVTVHAFEPTPEIAMRLRQTAALNGLEQKLHVYETAVSRHAGRASLVRFRGDSGTNEGMNFITAESSEPDAECVSTVCIDAFCVEHDIKHIDLLKLDIQGHEHEALAGAMTMLMAGRIGVVFTELNWAKGADQSCPASETVHILQRAGYQFAAPGTRLEWRESGDWLRSMSDVVARRLPSQGAGPP